MKTMPYRILLPVLAGLVAPFVTMRADDENSVLTSVFAKTDKNYQRHKDADGKWVREYYAMTNGGPLDGTIRDDAQEKIKFVSLATVLAQHLAHQGYFPATGAQSPDFLLVVNWGRTMPFVDNVYREEVKDVLKSINTTALKTQSAAQARANAVVVPGGDQGGSVNLTGTVEEMEQQAAESSLQSQMILQDMLNHSRDKSNARTARLLGYIQDINLADGPQRFVGGGNRYDDLISDIEEARYYIIVSAFDFQKTVKENSPKLLWVTRMSMRAPGNSFAEKAAAMIAYSSTRFGRNTDGLERKLYPQYKVNLEDTRFLGVAEAGKPSGTGK